ncbi:hypothetical protein [Sphingobium boeckii]|uniref:Uncharacterized protein n=1 Tax=Sphingobium boeckii TaxID=1082345 RepID=A0A7W9AHW7_9SPHN|nr:hypothetical protein [Sphingobium boeckii]MBB5685764.1 hypothetical protein [Sphingobium boeckii]
MRPARALRIHCPVDAATLQALLDGDMNVMRADPLLAGMLRIIEDDNPLGDFTLYQGVVEITPGWECFTPLPEARPAKGTADAPAISPTVILTTYIAAGAPEPQLADALDRIMALHPWEVPVIELVEMHLLVRTPA